jgi:hypothetical protein
MSMSEAEYPTPTWFCDLDGKRAMHLLRGEPAKKEWVVYKFPIKGGSVIRAAIQSDIFCKPVTWSIIEEKVKR